MATPVSQSPPRTVANESPEPLSVARHYFPGQPPALGTMRRYVTAGAYGIVLESILHRGQRQTSRAAVARFIDAISQPRTVAASSEVGR